MRIETERLIIGDIAPSDERALVEMASDGSLERDVGFAPDCGDWMGSWITWNAEQCEKDDPRGCESIAYMIRLKKGGEDGGSIPVGSVGCTYYEDTDRTGIVYFIGAKYRGSGYAAEAARAYAEYFLEHYGADGLSANIREENAASWKSAEKAGFKLADRRMYKDTGDDAEEMYRFYAYRRGD